MASRCPTRRKKAKDSRIFALTFRGGLGSPAALYLAAAGVGALAVGKILTYDAFFGDFDEIQLPEHEPNCAVCGDHPTITELLVYEQLVCRI